MRIVHWVVVAATLLACAPAHARTTINVKGMRRALYKIVHRQRWGGWSQASLKASGQLAAKASWEKRYRKAPVGELFDMIATRAAERVNNPKPLTIYTHNANAAKGIVSNKAFDHLRDNYTGGDPAAAGVVLSALGTAIAAANRGAFDLKGPIDFQTQQKLRREGLRIRLSSEYPPLFERMVQVIKNNDLNREGDQAHRIKATQPLLVIGSGAEQHLFLPGVDVTPNMP